MENQDPPDHEKIAHDAGIVDGNEEFALLAAAVASMARAALSADERTRSAVGLLVKFYAHASSAFHLSRGTIVPPHTERKPDLPSVLVVGRAAYETFFRFYHIFREPTTPEAMECMYIGWKLASYRGRQGYPTTQPSTKATKAQEKVILDQLTQQLDANAHYNALEKGEKKRLRREGKTKDWGEIALDAGLVGIHAGHYYRYLCGPAHSGWIDVARFAAADEATTAEGIRLALEATMIAMAFMLDAFARAFPVCRSILTSDQIAIIDGWKQIGSKPPATP